MPSATCGSPPSSRARCERGAVAGLQQRRRAAGTGAARRAARRRGSPRSCCSAAGAARRSRPQCCAARAARGPRVRRSVALRERRVAVAAQLRRRAAAARAAATRVRVRDGARDARALGIARRRGRGGERASRASAPAQRRCASRALPASVAAARVARARAELLLDARAAGCTCATRSERRERAGLDLAAAGRRPRGRRSSCPRSRPSGARSPPRSPPRARRGSPRASRVSVPIWFTLIRIAFATPCSMPCAQDRRVGDEQVVADELELRAELLRQRAPSRPSPASARPSSIETIG